MTRRRPREARAHSCSSSVGQLNMKPEEQFPDFNSNCFRVRAPTSLGPRIHAREKVRCVLDSDSVTLCEVALEFRIQGSVPTATSKHSA